MEKYEPLNDFFKNKRRHRRFEVEAMGIGIRAKPTSPESSDSENCRALKLNLGGVLMTSDHAHELNSKLMIEMTLPDNVLVSLVGRVTSCLPAKNRDAGYEVGIEFRYITEQDRNKLKKFIHRLYMEDAGFTG